LRREKQAPSTNGNNKADWKLYQKSFKSHNCIAEAMANSIRLETNLDEPNFLGIAAEALSAAHKTILSDYSMRIPANTAAETYKETR